MKRTVTISMIAAKAGLSRSAVTYMIKNIETISRNSREHILQVVERLEHGEEHERVRANVVRV